MARLPKPGGDEGNWGDILNSYLAEAHNADGSLKNTGILASKYTRPPGGIPLTHLANTVQSAISNATGATGAAGNDGREVELQASATHIQWRYVGTSSWANLLPLTDITGPQGQQGPAGSTGPAGAASTVQGPAGTNGTNGNDGSDGSDGNDGREVELQTSSTHVQWRYVGESVWNNLTSLADLTGPQGPAGADGADGSDGTSVTILGSYATQGELTSAHPTGSSGEAYIVAGDLYVWNGTAWENVGAIRGPQGPKGDDGDDGQPGADSTVAGPAGTPGTNGNNGREVELQTSATHIQWRYVGAATWTNLEALNDLRGPAGNDGNDGARGPAGNDGADGPAGPGVPTGGTTGQVLAKASASNHDTHWVAQSGGGSGSFAPPIYDDEAAVMTALGNSEIAVGDIVGIDVA